MKSSIDGTGADKHFGMGAALAVVLALAAIIGMMGCTSDEPNLVGAALVTDSIDTVLATLGAEEITMYSALQVENPDTPNNYNVPVYRQEVLYLGERNGTRCDGFLVNFDFDIEFTADYPESLFTEENISAVKLSLTKLNYYSAREDDGGIIDNGQPVDLYYELQTVEAPFDSLEYRTYPVEAPVPTGPFLNSNFNDPNNFDEVFLPLFDSRDLLEWIQAKEKVGFVVSLAAQSDTGLVGFASRELTHFNEIPPVQKNTIPAPNFVVEFQDSDIPAFLISPYADTTTFVEVPEAPADPSDGFLLRTGLRSYPVLLFDLSSLPPNAFINRALLTVTNDREKSFGPLSGIGVLEWETTFFGDPYRTIPLRDINDPYQYYSFYVTGQTSLDPRLNQVINFDVTQAILRIINNVYDGTRGLLLTGGEKFLPVGLSSYVTPDFFYEEFRFMGTGAADPADRPQLKITYSIVNEINGESK